MKIYISTDHRGVEYENILLEYLKGKGIEVIRTKLTHNDTDDYPDFAFELAKNVVKDENSMGILICRTGIGMSIAANKVKGARAACCRSVEDAHLTRLDNNSNILCLSYDVPIEDLYRIVDEFIKTPFSVEERHQRRVNKIIKYENGEYNEL